LPLSTWTHLAATYDGATLRLYVNGVQVGTRVGSGTMLTSTGALRIGGNSIWGEFFQGRLDEVRIYNRALTQVEIQADMNTPVGIPPADTTAPVRSNGQPTGTLPVGTTQTTLSLTTSENATCRYSTGPGLAYGSMPNAFTTTGGTAHSTPVTGLTNGGSYSYYVRCQDGVGNANPDDFGVTFTVANPPADTTPPVRSNGQPTGMLPAGTTQTALGLTTNESAMCRFATSGGVAYASMPNVFTTTGGTTHSTSVTGLTNGGSYTYYVRCLDGAGNPNITDFAISFSVAVGPDKVLPVVALTAPSNGATVAGVVTVAANASDNIGVVGVQFLLNGANLGAEDTTSPYSVSWDTSTVPVGPHALSARARDAAANVATSAIVNVAVTNNPVPAGFRDEVIIGSGLTFPTAFEFLPDGRMLIAEFGGKVFLAQPGATSVDPTPVLQLANIFNEDVTIGGERGLVNVVADPAFATNGYIYLFYTAATPQRDRVSRFTMIGNTASLASELVVWQAIANSTSTDHHGGGLAFGPDGTLYISTGDNGTPSSSQPLTGDHGKILRVNKDGTVPSNNPFVDGTGPNVDAIWARGLRNPYRFSFDPANGRMYIGDVGGNGANSIEELNVGAAGANYGWPTCEGSCATAGMTNPIFTYPHGGRDAAITGGFVYRNVSGLVASYSFSEGSGSTTQDASGNSLTGTISGATWTTAGKFGSALSFDGVNDWVTVADANALDLTTSMTLEAWVFPTALGSSWRNVIIKERPGGEVYNLYANTDTSVPAAYVVPASAPSTTFDARGTAQLPVNTWSHLAATYDGSTLRLYINGAQVGSRVGAGALITSTGALRVGGNSLWGEYFAGRIDEVRVYSRALSAAEIQADMNSAQGVSAGQFPAPYQGAYFYGDFAQNVIRYLTLDGSGNVTGSGNFLPADGSPDGPYDPVMLKPGPDGSLYYVDFGWGWQSTQNPAAIRRIRYTPGNQPPIAVVSAAPLNGAAPLSVNFSRAGSSDPEGQPLSYSWSFGDGGTSTQPDPTHLYTQPGAYNARLSVSDGTNTTLSGFLIITVGAPPVGTITSPSNGLTFRAGDVISFAGSASDAEDGPLAPSAFSWTVLFHHDSHMHPAVGPVSGSTTGTFAIPTSGHDFAGNTRYEVVLTVTDSHGLQSTSSVFVFPQKVNLSFSTSPAGLVVTVDGISQTTPYVKDSLIGFQHTLGAPNQVQGSLSYTFSSWSDGGSQSHAIVVPSSALSYVATFQSTGPPPPPPGLVAGYGFSEGSGTTTQDASGNNLTGTISGATRTTSGKFGNALSFDGVNDWVTVADANALDLTTGMTLEAWVFPAALGSSWRNVIIKERPGGEVYNLYANVDTSVPVVYVARASAPGTPLDARGTAPLPLNTWSHLAATYDGATLRLYVNGSQVGTRAVTGAMVASTGVLRVGGNSLWGEYFSGRIDEVRIYNRALTATEIQTDMNTPLP
jgi:glucose/arabinose dehydrogenase